jgi:hypothetical protein
VSGFTPFIEHLGKKKAVRMYLYCCVLVAIFFSLMLFSKSVAFAAFDFMFAPGGVLAALIFPLGIHGDFAYPYLALAVVINSLLWALLPMLGLFLLGTFWKNLRKRTDIQT